MATVTPPASVLSGKQAEPYYVARVAALTGLDPNVVQAWVNAEGAYAPNGTGGNNFLNIRESTSKSGVPLAGTTSAGFAQFHSAMDAATETAHWINTMPNYKVIRQSKGLGPLSQIAAIAASPWDSGHYDGGKKLYSAYASTNKGVDWGKIGSWVKDIPLPTPLPGLPGVGLPGLPSLPNPLAAPEQLARDASQVIGFVFNPHSWLRIGYIIGGGVFAIGGLFILARSVGSSNAAQAVKDSAQTAASLTPAGREAKAAQAAAPARRYHPTTKSIKVSRDRPSRPRAGEPGSSQLGPGDSLPF